LSPLLEMTLRFLLAVGFFTLVSAYGFSGTTVDISRVAAGVVVGVGFIGAGVIFRGRQEEEVAGLTTAATIWVTAAIGLAAGAGMYLISIIATAIITGILLLPKIRG
jgi:putative Mg2+ transporter-C (MgtC) family protein